MNIARNLTVLAFSLLITLPLFTHSLMAQPPGRGGERGGGFGERGGSGERGGFSSRGGPSGGMSSRRGGFSSRGGDPSSFLSRLDANGNGIIDPDEQKGPAQFIIARMQQSDPSIKPGQPIPLKKITEGFAKMREQRDSGSSRTSVDTSNAADEALMPELLVPGFGVEEEPPLLMGFGAAAEMLSVPVTPADEKEANERMRRYDRNRDGFLTKNELSSRFAGNPMDFDRNRDGKLSVSELAVRYARRREGEEEAKRAKNVKRRRSESKQETEPPDVFNGRRSYRPTASRKLPEGLPGFFTDKDANSDGQVTMAEFASEWTDSVLAEFFDSDFNRDGVITADEALRKVEKGGALAMASSSSGSRRSSSTRATSSSSEDAPASGGDVGPAEEKYLKLGKRIIDRYDKNKDEQLTPSEWKEMLMSPAAADGNRDGKITVVEYALWIQSRQKK